jgi:hypothetical protein
MTELLAVLSKKKQWHDYTFIFSASASHKKHTIQNTNRFSCTEMWQQFRGNMFQHQEANPEHVKDAYPS